MNDKLQRGYVKDANIYEDRASFQSKELLDNRFILEQLYSLLSIVRKKEDTFVFTYCGGKAEDELDVELKAMENKTAEEIFPLHIATRLKDYLAAGFEGKRVEFESLYLDRYFFTIIHPVIKEGEITEVIMTSQDITKRKHVEREESEKTKLYFSVFHEASDGMSFFNNEGVHFDVNKALCEIFGRTKEQVQQKLISFFTYNKDWIKELNRKGEVKGEYVIEHSNGSTRIIEYVAKANLLPGKHLAIHRDITNRKTLEDRLMQAEKLKVVGEMAAGVAHELRNPMTSLKGFLQLMRYEKETNPHYIDITLSELQRMEEIITDFMTLAKPAISEKEANNLGEILREAIDVLQPEASLRNVTVQPHLGEDCWFECTRNQMKQVFINLIKNGMDAMEDGGCIKLTAKKEMGDIVIQVEDEGCGMNEETLQRIGEPFYTTKAKGTGLGLMVTYKIVNDHNGKIEIDSEEGKGTVFRLLFPLG
ncbi:PAS domain-containing sensor histidine kinase [Bacillus sp. FJAT-44742]|uniref:PAS domain-containing sensor histidine kinase n=1 Tax=Bacillus sp. FJAT-44742 TaxID=2014005 RepID=UPI000C23DC31|nr:PAS domain-containing sensor histidine kinase [Bacillus sp. FJAT-44742]